MNCSGVFWNTSKGRSSSFIQRRKPQVQLRPDVDSMLRHLRKEVLPKNPRMFALMAEGPLDEMRRLQAEIEQLTNGLAVTPATAAT